MTNPALLSRAREYRRKRYSDDRWQYDRDQVDTMLVEFAEVEVKEMREDGRKIADTLEEAMDWNWLSDDMPEDVALRIEAALTAFRAKVGEEGE